jgi:hypothetical protein
MKNKSEFAELNYKDQVDTMISATMQDGIDAYMDADCTVSAHGCRACPDRYICDAVLHAVETYADSLTD